MQLVLFKSKNKENTQRKIIKFFQNNPYPKDKEVHKFAEHNNIDPDVLETEIYSLLSSILSEGKKEAKNPDPKELKAGIKIEMEHTNNPVIAERVALQHLSEFRDYYTRLKAMEKKAKGE